MSVPLWISLLSAVIAGLFAAVIAPLITARLATKNWRAQRTLELRYEVFRDASAALASWAADALDFELQAKKSRVQGHDAHVRAPLSIENVPSMEFEDKRLAFINAARSELDLMDS